MSEACDYPAAGVPCDFAGGFEMLGRCRQCGSFNFAYEVIDPPCPHCGARMIATAIPDLPELDLTRVEVAGAKP